MLTIHHFETISDFLGVAKAYKSIQGTEWYGGIHPDQAFELARTGDESAVLEAEQFIAAIEAAVQLPETVGFQTLRGPFGPRLDVGAWLAGAPDPMRRRVRRVNDISPVRIFVDLFTSCAISAPTMRRRGQAIIAFLLLAQRLRPIELYAGASSSHTGRLGDRYISIRLDSKPISLAQVGFTLGHPAFFRSLLLGYYGTVNPSAPSMPCVYNTPAECKAHLELGESDVFIQKAALGDELLSDPLAWIQREIARITNTEETQ